MSRLWKVPGTIAEYTLGTMIVLFQVGVIQPLEQRRANERRADTDTRRRAKAQS
jgi:hypothetical protein